MIDLWLLCALLLLIALGFLLIPLLRARREQTEEDRTGLNVALYQERLAEMQGQHDAGTLTAEQFEAGRAEAARELLEDTQGIGPARVSRIGRGLPIALALLLPLLGLGLYLHWGASDKLALTRELQQPPRDLADMIQRLERTVAVQPESSESWYFLGRAYMANERYQDAADAFAGAIQSAGREPTLLGLQAQAQFFANDKKWSEAVQKLVDEALALDANEPTTLGLVGIAAFESGDFRAAVDYWQRLLAVLPAEDPTRDAIQNGIRAASERGGFELPAADVAQKAAPEVNAAAVAPVELRVRVTLAAALQDKVQPGDSLFVFARALSGPPMPLAVKRLAVADLPAEISLSDADAMLPQLKLSLHPQVELVARISRAGDATAGEWVGRSGPLANSEQATQTLIIDQPE
jgi:cytochrome c-type biogenesis protein CcmH